MTTMDERLTRSDLREELDRTFRHYVTKADLEHSISALERRMLGYAFAGVATGVTLVVTILRIWQ